MGRIVCQFSCGAASAVAAKLVIGEARATGQEVLIVNAFIQQEDKDNRRFLEDCIKWFDHPVTVVRDVKYGASTYEVWSQRRFMKNRFTAPCSGAL